MNAKQFSYSDVWEKNKVQSTRIPKNAELICVHRIVVQALLDVDEYLFLNQTTKSNELWCIAEVEPEDNCVLNDTTLRYESMAVLLLAELYSPSKRDVCLRLLEELIRARIGFYSLPRLIRSGLVNVEEHQMMGNCIRDEIDRNGEQPSQLKSLIITEATRLGLHPELPLLNQKIWSANCPGTNHKLFINAEKGEFGCGYCQVKGDHEKLVEFVDRRKR